MPGSSTQKLALAILLSAIKKHATEIRLSLDVHGVVRVELLIDGAFAEELRPPPLLFLPLLERYAAMASMRFPSPGEVSLGRLHLMLGEASHHHFELELSAPGGQHRLRLRPIAREEFPPEDEAEPV